MTLAVGGTLNTNSPTCLHRGCVAQSVKCLTADPGGASSIPVRSHTFVEIDREIISMAILIVSCKGKEVCAQSMG